MSEWLLLAAEDAAKSPTFWEWFGSMWEWKKGLALSAWDWLQSPCGRITTAGVLGAIGLWLLLPGAWGRVWLFAPLARWLGWPSASEDEPEYRGFSGAISWSFRQATSVAGFGAVLAIVAWLLILSLLPPAPESAVPVVFWTLAGLTVISAVATISMQSPVYSAIWFALTLLGTGGLMLIQGAQFLGVATIVVYAGAILVTFLFVLMLSQPEGHAWYDRVSWSSVGSGVAVLVGVALLGLLASRLSGLDGDLVTKQVAKSPPTLAAKEKLAAPRDVESPDHVARLGAQLFTRHLVAIEIGGTLLLVALVGAVAIAIHGKPRGTAALEGGVDHE